MVTGILLLRRSIYAALISVFTATLLLVDGLFDTLFAAGNRQAKALLLAVCIEWPLAIVCVWTAMVVLKNKRNSRKSK
jgi:hypothetical protein